MPLADFIQSSRTAILAEWEHLARRGLAKAATLDHPALLDHLPALLDAIAEATEREGAGQSADLSEDAPDVHVLHRLEEGYDLAQVVYEYALLRRVMVRRLAGAGGSLPLAQLLQLNRFIDQAVAHAVTRYTQARQRTLTSLDRLTEGALGATQADAFLDELVAVMIEAIPSVDSAAILLLQEDRLRVRSAGGHLAGAIGFSVNPGESVAGEVLATAKPVLVTEAASDPRIRWAPLRATPLRALYCVPMVTDGRTVGVATIASATTSDFSREDLRLLRLIVSRATAHLVRAELAAREQAARVEAEDQRRQAAEREALLRLVVDGVKDYAIFLVNTEGRIASWNSGAARIKGYEAEEAIGMPFENLFPAAERAAGRPALEMKTAAEKGRYEGEARRLRKDGSVFDAEVALWAVREQGELRGFVKFTKDVSERRQRDREREMLLAEAKAAVLARDEFIATAAHDLRSPLASLDLQAQMILRKARRPDGQGPPRSWAVSKLEGMANQIGRMSSLLDDLLDVSRIAAGRLRLSLEDVDLAALAREVAARFEERLDLAGCTLTVRAGAPVTGRWDRLRLDQIVTNLLSNAVKYGRGHPVDLWVTADPGTAWLGVRDHGGGIADDEQARLFQKFERVGNQTAAVGSGLGLWIVKGAAEAMGGSVNVRSEIGDGATFTVELPRQPAG